MVNLNWFEKIVIFLTIYIIILNSTFGMNTYTDLNDWGIIFYNILYLFLTTGIWSVLIKIIEGKHGKK